MGCRAFAGDVKVLAAGRVRYPDFVVTCARINPADDIVLAPLLVVEILSPSTARTDRSLKLEEYRLTPSIAYYLLLEPDAAEGVLYSREGERWMAAAIVAPADIVLPQLGLSVSIAEAYREIIAQD